jgi:hypothetical protein
MAAFVFTTAREPTGKVGRHPLERFQATLSGFDAAAQSQFFSGNFAPLFAMN